MSEVVEKKRMGRPPGIAPVHVRGRMPEHEQAMLKQARAYARGALGKFNVAEFLAQTEASNCIQTLAGFRDDWNLTPEFRARCALDLLDRGYGKPKQTASITIGAPMDIEPGDHYSQQIEGAMMMADSFRELNAWVTRGIPYDEWPDHVKEMAGEAGAAAMDEKNAKE